MRARVLTLDRSLEEAARDLGAGPWATFWLVTLPMILPGVLAGALLAFAMSIDDFVVTSFMPARRRRSRCGSGPRPVTACPRRWTSWAR